MFITVYIYNATLFSHKNDILTFVMAWMGLEGIVLSKIIQTEQDKYHIISFSLYGLLKEWNSQIKRTNWWLPRVVWGGQNCEGGQKVQTSGYNIGKSWECEAQHAYYS